MSCPVSVGRPSSRKRQGPEEYLDEHCSKRQKLVRPSSAFWDNLSKIWLTRDALKELDRRNRASSGLPKPLHSQHRPLTRLQERLRHRNQTFAFDPVNCSPESLREIRRFSRGGGPDLSDLRNFPNPHIIPYQSMSAINSGRRKRRAGSPSEPAPENSSTNKTAKTTSTTAYNRNFEQNLIDHGIYPPGYKYPKGRKPAKPDNWLELNDRLAQRRASLSPSQFSEDDFEEFTEADMNASKEKPIVRFAFPAIEGHVDDTRCVWGDFPFGNLGPLTDGTLATAKPDHFFGSRPEELNSQIRDELSSYIFPSTQNSLPIVPNFFLETKGPDGSLAVATRQACYHGALGARGIHKLQSYKQDEPSTDQNAYTITSTYHGGQLKLYTTHMVPREGERPEYIMTQINAWSMVGNIESFRQGAAAYRNAQAWAEEQRDRFIHAANERLTQSRSEIHSSEWEAQTVVLEDSETSPTSDEAEPHDAAWSFAQPNDGNKSPRASRKHTNKAGDSASGKSLAN